jgi:hypothetical protein
MKWWDDVQKDMEKNRNDYLDTWKQFGEKIFNLPRDEIVTNHCGISVTNIDYITLMSNHWINDKVLLGLLRCIIVD